jgi:SPP1 gp7 family putative phage head morphogenesis protein
MSRQVSEGEGVPSVFYRNAIDLNRFGTGLARKIREANTSVLLKSIQQLSKTNEKKGPAYKAARLRALIKQTKKTLSSWEKESVAIMIKELEGIAKVQAGFVEEQMRKSIPNGMKEKVAEIKGIGSIESSVSSVAISPSFAKAVVTNTPIKFDLGDQGKFNLTARQGSEILLPNGETIQKAFRGLASKQVNQFNQSIRTGLLSGEPTSEIARQMTGVLEFGEQGNTFQTALAGSPLNMAKHQINTIVRTSVHQVSNAASQSVYKANRDITEEYRYVATLDSRTSPVCRDLDGEVFKYDQGPLPPQHFGCRSTTVAVINYKKYGFTPPPVGKRASADGPVPANTTYGKWLYDQRAETKSGKLSQFTPGPEQIKALGKEKAKYFNRLADKYGADKAMSKFMREDGTEVSLKRLEKRYGKPSDIKKSPQIKRPDIAGPGTAPLRLTKKDPFTTTWDPDEALRKAQANTEKNYLGSGAFASAYKLDGDPPTVIKKGTIGRYEVEALNKLKDTGISPKVLSEKYTTDWKFSSDIATRAFEKGTELKGFEHIKTREGSFVMTQAKGKTIQELLRGNNSSYGDFLNPKKPQQRESMFNQYIKARKEMHLKGIAHNDMHAENFFFDEKTNKGTVIDFGLAQINPKAALIEALGLETGADESGQLVIQDMVGDKSLSNFKVYKKLSGNIFNVKNELDKRGLGKLADEILDWEVGENFTKPKFNALSDSLAKDLLKIVYKGI